MSYIKPIKVLFESCDGVLTISTSSQKLYVTADDGLLMITKVYSGKFGWEDACKPTKLLNDVKALLGSRYTQELLDRHEEFFDYLISYWED